MKNEEVIIFSVQKWRVEHCTTRVSTDEHSDPTPFVKLLAEHERYLGGYVYHLIPNAADAEDVLQDIKVALWKAFDQYELGTNFGAWSRKVAFHRVMAFRKKKAIEGKRLTFSDECFEYLSDHYSDDSHHIDEMAKRLAVCISKLKKPHQELVSLRYKESFSIEETSVRTGKTIAACYRALSRIRLALRQCLQQSSHVKP